MRAEKGSPFIIELNPVESKKYTFNTTYLKISMRFPFNSTYKGAAISIDKNYNSLENSKLKEK